MKVLCIGGSYDGRRLDLSKVTSTVRVPQITNQGMIEQVYRHETLRVGERTFDFYVHSNLTTERAFESLVDRYPRGLG